MKRNILAACCLLMCGSTMAVAAVSEHACSVTYVPGQGQLGSDGYVAVTLYSGAYCSGSYNETQYLCTSGATYGQCGLGRTYSEPALLQGLQSLQNAAEWGARVDGSKGSCNQIPNFGCWQNFTVYSQ
jgi:hypothetical protein